MKHRRNRERGTALVAAVVGAAILSFMALEILDTDRGNVALMQAKIDHLRLVVAADSVIEKTIYELGKSGAPPSGAGGTPQETRFDGVILTVSVQDERGKVPINSAKPDEERRLFAAAGVAGERLNELVDALEDWKDSDDAAHASGAEASYYLPMAIKPRNGDLRTLGELGAIKGMDKALLARIAPSITVERDRGGAFDERFATALAMAAMRDQNAIVRELKMRLDPSRGPALALTDNTFRAGRVWAIAVEARLENGGYFRRDVVVQFTGDQAAPYWIRSVQ